MIYHVTTEQEWEKARQQGYYEAASLATEGFIHLSEERQVAGVLERYFRNQSGLVLLEIAEEKLQAPLRYEWSPSVQDNFPHLFGPLNLEAVTGTRPVSSQPSGNS